MTDPDRLDIPMPRFLPLGLPVDDKGMVQDVWDVFVQPAQERSDPQSGEMRVLMAILRAVYKGLEERENAQHDPAT